MTTLFPVIFSGIPVGLGHRDRIVSCEHFPIDLSMLMSDTSSIIARDRRSDVQWMVSGDTYYRKVMTPALKGMTLDLLFDAIAKSDFESLKKLGLFSRFIELLPSPRCVISPERGINFKKSDLSAKLNEFSNYYLENIRLIDDALFVRIEEPVISLGTEYPHMIGQFQFQLVPAYSSPSWYQEFPLGELGQAIDFATDLYGKLGKDLSPLSSLELFGDHRSSYNPSRRICKIIDEHIEHGALKDHLLANKIVSLHYDEFLFQKEIGNFDLAFRSWKEFSAENPRHISVLVVDNVLKDTLLQQSFLTQIDIDMDMALNPIV